jgi:invasion protein IalB
MYRHRVKVAAAAVVCFLAFSSGTVVAQDTAIGQPRAQAAPAWEVICTGSQAGLDCRVGQSMPFIGNDPLIVAVRVPPDTKVPRMLVKAPLGTYLRAGLMLQFGNDTVKILPFESCDQSGCFAEYPVTQAEIAAMLNGADLTISVQNLKKQSVTVKMLVAGFSAAYAKIK